MIFGIAAGIFLSQLLMLFRVKHPLWKLTPVYLTGGMELLCLLTFLLGKILKKELLSFSAFMLGFIGCWWAAGAVLAWAVYAIRKTVQKRKK